MPTDSLMSLLLAGLSIIFWTVLLTRHWLCVRQNSCHHARPHRVGLWAMYMVGLAASMGTFASAWGGYVSGGGVPPIVIDRQVLIFIAGIGRGALLFGAIVLLVMHPERRRKTDLPDNLTED